MRRFLLLLFAGVLLWLIGARAFLPEALPARETMAGAQEYNVLTPDLTAVPHTAGSAVVAEISAHYIHRIPTEKNEYTGLFEGCNLILICAPDWSPDLGNSITCPSACELHREGIRFADVYRPDWYQGAAGREFALLTGLVPTNINGSNAMLHTGEQNIWLPFSLGHAFSGIGYDTLVSFRETAHLNAYRALGFSRRVPADANPLTALISTIPVLEATEPFFACYFWDTADGEPALAFLLDWLETGGFGEKTVLCLLTGNGESHRAQIFLRGPALTPEEVSLPCSEVDIAPTLLNLFGLGYDSRFLSGRDVFSSSGAMDAASSITPIVTLYGSAYSDWITPAGSYIAADRLFWQRQDCFEDPKKLSGYVNDICQEVYDRYIYTRKIMETDYFRQIFPGG